MTTPQQILSLVDENKEKLTDEVYKNLCDKLMELNKAPDQYVRLTGIRVKIKTVEYCEGEEESNYLRPESKSVIVQVVDKIGQHITDQCHLDKGLLCKEEYEKIVKEIESDGYRRLKETYCDWDKTMFLVTKMEPLK